MPRHVDRPLPPADDLARSLAEAGVTGVPADGVDTARAGLFWMAGYFVENAKTVSFPQPFSWDNPRFTVTDAKARVDVAYAILGQADSVADVLREALPRIRDITLLGLDARVSGLREYELEHEIYGQVTLFSWPHKPAEPMDRRVHEARERGWGATLKHHNLLPGRGIVVLDEQHGALLADDAVARKLPGILVLLPGGAVHLWWNPFCEGLSAEMEHYLSWGHGEGRPSEWKEVLRYEGDDEG